MLSRIITRIFGKKGASSGQNRDTGQDQPLRVRDTEIFGDPIVNVSDGRIEAQFRPTGKGVYTKGTQLATDLIDLNRDILEAIPLSTSVINVMCPVTNNEGMLDAVDTSGEDFLAFGIFRWSLGVEDRKGELPAMLGSIKKLYPEKFQEYFGRYGLDLDPDNTRIYGYLTLEGQSIRRPEQKEQFRNPEWAYRFYRSGQDDYIMAAQLFHAAERLKTFYWKTELGVGGHPMSKLITSEYGVALLLAHHANRPGYVQPCLQKAVDRVQPGDPDKWSAEDEQKVLEAYLEERVHYGATPMDNAERRAEVTYGFLLQEMTSDQRGSFVFDPKPDPDANLGDPPGDYSEADYEVIRHYDA